MKNLQVIRTLNELARCTVWHPDFKEARRLIIKSIATTAERGDPSSALLTGHSGVGKTRLCKIIERDLGMTHVENTEAHQKLIRPCVYVEVPPSATLKSVACEILTELLKTAIQLPLQKSDVKIDEDKFSNHAHEKWSLARLETMIIQRLHTLETVLLILDEFHHVADRGQDATKLAICNWLTNLLNKSQVSILLSGSMKISTIVDSVPELSGRYSYRATLKELNLANDADAPTFLGILSGLESEMIRLGGLNKYVHLTDPKLYKAMFLATNGNFRALSVLLNDSFERALLRGNKTLDIEDFIEAWWDLHTDKLYENPFRMSTKELDSKLATQRRNTHEQTVLRSQTS